MKMGAFVLGYHGCDRSVGENLLAGEDSFQSSKNAYDWLGHGIYFWENNPNRAIDWAKMLQKRAKSKVHRPFAVGAIIDLGNCLDLTESQSLGIVREGYKSLEEVFSSAGFLDMPRNREAGKRDSDLLYRNLDCAVINHVHEMRDIQKMDKFDSVRGAFPEGKELYPGAGIKDKTHIQICVRDPSSIRGVFRIPGIR